MGGGGVVAFKLGWGLTSVGVAQSTSRAEKQRVRFDTSVGRGTRGIGSNTTIPQYSSEPDLVSRALSSAYTEPELNPKFRSILDPYTDDLDPVTRSRLQPIQALDRTKASFQARLPNKAEETESDCSRSIRMVRINTLNPKP